MRLVGSRVGSSEARWSGRLAAGRDGRRVIRGKAVNGWVELLCSWHKSRSRGRKRLRGELRFEFGFRCRAKVGVGVGVGASASASASTCVCVCAGIPRESTK